MYITLAHGRIDANQTMAEWGTIGPSFEVNRVDARYMDNLSFVCVGDYERKSLTTVNGLVYYAGVYYGAVWIETAMPSGSSVSKFDQRLAEAPEQD